MTLKKKNKTKKMGCFGAASTALEPQRPWDRDPSAQIQFRRISVQKHANPVLLDIIIIMFFLENHHLAC